MFKIKEITYKDDRALIILDSEKKLEIPLSIFYKYQLSLKEEISENDFQALELEAEIFQGERKALDFLARRIRSSLEVKNYLKRKKISDEIIEKIIKKLRELNYINDYDFAVKYIQYKLRQKEVGVHLLRKELLLKGIKKEDLEQALEEGGAFEIDYDRLYELAYRKCVSLEKKKNKKAKLLFFLFQRGFSKEIVYKIINDLEQKNYLG